MNIKDLVTKELLDIVDQIVKKEVRDYIRDNRASYSAPDSRQTQDNTYDNVLLGVVYEIKDRLKKMDI